MAPVITGFSTAATEKLQSTKLPLLGSGGV